MLADAHCHLINLPEKVIERAQTAGVEYFLTPGVTLEETSTILSLTTKHAKVYGAIAQHPSEKNSTINYEELKKQAQLPKIVAIGETGLDFQTDDQEEHKRQINLLEMHLSVAADLNKPVILHLRNASTTLLQKVRHYGVRGMVHCFTDTWEVGKQFLDLGFLLSFSGIITFKKSGSLRDTFKKIPLDKILVETDAPFLTPEPLRGKTNEPAFVTYVALLGANLLGVKLSVFAKQTTQNFIGLVGGNL